MELIYHERIETKVDTYSVGTVYLTKDKKLVIESVNGDKFIFPKQMTEKIAKCLNHYGMINVSEIYG